LQFEDEDVQESRTAITLSTVSQFS